MQFETILEMSHSGPLTLRVDGGCMGESLPDGSLVTIKSKTIYWPGDVVVVARGDDRLVSHRLLGYFYGRKGWNVITRADNEKDHDDPVPVARVLGKATQVDGKDVSFSLLGCLAAAGAFLRVLPRVLSCAFSSRISTENTCR